MITITLTEDEAGELETLLEYAADLMRDKGGSAESENEPGLASNYNTQAWAADHLRKKVKKATKAATKKARS